MARGISYSIQLYSARNFPPVADHFAHLAALGYDSVETVGSLYDDPQALRAGLDVAGLTAPSGHFPLTLLDGDPDKACRIADTLGMQLIVCPFVPPDVRPSLTDDWRRFGERIAGIARRLKPRGFDFAWHNHDFEFRPLKDGSLPIQHIAADPAVQLEIDVAWVALAGIDPQPWIEGYAGRIAAVHVKDIAPRGGPQEEGGWADVGAGVMPWPKLWRTATGHASLMIAEHDDPADFSRFARRSIEAMRSFSDMLSLELSVGGR